MSFPALEIPDEPSQLAPWMEGHLVGLELFDVVAGLEAVLGDGVDSLKLEDVCREDLSVVLTSGLSVLSSEQLRQLLRNPRLLLDLQERILVEGDSYWYTIPSASKDLKDITDQTWNRIVAQLGLVGINASKSTATESRSPWYSHPSIVSLATAAAVLVAVFGWSHFMTSKPASPAVAGWGWDRPGAINDGVDAATYLSRLADAADEWYEKRPDDPAALARRISQFRQGCSTLILSDHRPLDEEDRKWLVERCQTWASKFDEHLAAVEAGDDVLEVRVAIDETISKLSEALRSRASSVG